MKKLSFILVLIMTMMCMVGMFTTTAFAAGEGTEANPITVGGEGADYATVGEALAAVATLGQETTYIKVNASTTETTAAITLNSNVVIYSDATGDERPTITVAADASIGEASYGYWILVDGAALTLKGVQLDSSAFNTALNASKASGTFTPVNGAKISVVNCTVANGGNSAKNGGFIHFNGATHNGDIVIDNSTITSDNRGIHFASSKGTSSVTLINGSSIKSTNSHAIQASITTMDALSVRVVNSTLEAKSQAMYNRALKATVELINANVKVGTIIVDARNDKATLDLTVVGGTFSGTELTKFKSTTAVVNVIGADLTGVTSAVVNNELSSENVTVNTYGVTGKFTNVPAEKITKLDEAGARTFVGEWFANDEALKDTAVNAVPHICVFDQKVVDAKYLATKATCTAKATYFFSCACGEKGTDAFEDGEVLPHVFDQEVAGEDYLVSDATCTAGAVYYKSCECGLKGEETFMSIGSLGHLFGDWATVTEPTSEAEGLKERECSVCGEKETKAIAKLPVEETPEEPAPEQKPGLLGKLESLKGLTPAEIFDKVVNKAKSIISKGCGSAIGGTSIIIMMAAAGAVIACKKKED